MFRLAFFPSLLVTTMYEIEKMFNRVEFAFFHLFVISCAIMAYLDY